MVESPSRVGDNVNLSQYDDGGADFDFNADSRSMGGNPFGGGRPSIGGESAGAGSGFGGPPEVYDDGGAGFNFGDEENVLGNHLPP